MKDKKQIEYWLDLLMLFILFSGFILMWVVVIHYIIKNW